MGMMCWYDVHDLDGWKLTCTQDEVEGEDGRCMHVRSCGVEDMKVVWMEPELPVFARLLAFQTMGEEAEDAEVDWRYEVESGCPGEP